MDPQAILEAWRECRERNARRGARDALRILRAWLANGGFEPVWASAQERAHVIHGAPAPNP